MKKQRRTGRCLVICLALLVGILLRIQEVKGGWYLLHKGALAYEKRSKELHLGVKLSLGEVVKEYDDHGGFHGDGITYEVYQFSNKEAKMVEEEIKKNSHWNSLPLVSQLEMELYGEDQGEVVYGSMFQDVETGVMLPKVKNGSWYFYNRFEKEIDPYDATRAFSTMNYTAAIYDRDKKCLYYIEKDI